MLYTRNLLRPTFTCSTVYIVRRLEIRYPVSHVLESFAGKILDERTPEATWYPGCTVR
jgi:hypothetical protein